jgi:hypothetical protein
VLPVSNAPRAVARRGFEIYLASNPRPDLDTVNSTLEEQGFSKVAPRTYTHYEKLDRFGQRVYIPINRFDVGTAGPSTN